MAASIKRNTDAGELAGITAGKSYPVQGYTGGGVVIINDDNEFEHVGFARIKTEWSVEVEVATKAEPEKDEAKLKTKPKVETRPEPAAEPAAEPTATT